MHLLNQREAIKDQPATRLYRHPQELCDWRQKSNARASLNYEPHES